MSRALSVFMAAGLAVLCGAAGSAHGATASFVGPAFDKWMYGNVTGTEGGQAKVAPTFAFLDSADEDRMGAFLVAFDTATLVPANLGAGAYAITSVKLTVTIGTPDTFLYDPSHDAYQTSLPTGNAAYQADTDTGRPVELFGVGLRNGYTQLKGSISGGSTPYLENSPFGTSGQPVFRNAYPLGVNNSGTLFDVADNVGQGLEATPFGVGTTDLPVGSSVPQGAQFTFELQLGVEAILSYLQSGLSDGILGFYISSLHPVAGQNGPQTYPRFFTREGAADFSEPGFAPQLEITYTLVPEPSATLSLVLGLGLVTAGRAFHRRRFLS